jgi:hypothetical protein
MEDEADMDSVLDGNYGAQTLTQIERIHYGNAIVNAEIVCGNW